jgi:glutathione synthase/RimK-type ligase-like ATP-grasp enzyme
MKKVLILTRFRGEYEPKRLKQEAESLGMEVDVVNYEKIGLAVSEDGTPEIDLGTNRALFDYDLIIPRASSAKGKISMIGVKTVILESLHKLGDKSPKVINGKSFAEYPLMGKLEQGLLLAQAGLPAIPFRSFVGRQGWKELLGQDIDLPVMVKMRFGSHGKNVKLAETRERLVKLSEKYSEGTVLIQPVLKVRRWYRVIVLGGQVLGCMKHRQKSKFQSEEIQTEMGEIKPMFSGEQMEELKDISLTACKLFNIDYAGLDVAWEEERQKWMIFEINRTAQFKWFEKAYPEINVAGAMVNWGQK